MKPMSSVIFCAATKFELEAFPHLAGAERVETGVGIPQVFLTLPGRVHSVAGIRIVNGGIAGAYPNSGLTLGDIVIGTSEVYGDLGFELPEEPGFRALAESEFGAPYREPFPLKVPDTLERTGLPFSTGRGCTVNTCTGTRKTGERRERIFAAQFETMEGAAAAQIGAAAGVSVIEIRAISNFASDRDMKPETIRLALQNLRRFLERWLSLEAGSDGQSER